jgi:hypothetical protein
MGFEFFLKNLETNQIEFAFFRHILKVLLAVRVYFIELVLNVFVLVNFLLLVSKFLL